MKIDWNKVIKAIPGALAAFSTGYAGTDWVGGIMALAAYVLGVAHQQPVRPNPVKETQGVA